MSLETFVSEPVVVEIAGETLAIAPLKVGELPTFIRAIRPFAQHLSGDVDWLALFGERGEDLVSALAVAIRKPRDWVAARELDEAIRLSEAVFEVNADFFIQRLAPVLARVASRVEMIGARFYNASSNTATATQKS